MVHFVNGKIYFDTLFLGFDIPYAELYSPSALTSYLLVCSEAEEIVFGRILILILGKPNRKLYINPIFKQLPMG